MLETALFFKFLLSVTILKVLKGADRRYGVIMECLFWGAAAGLLWWLHPTVRSIMITIMVSLAFDIHVMLIAVVKRNRNVTGLH